jgi:carboxymethylenebutenolidase
MKSTLPLLALGLALSASPALPQDWAKARLEKSPRHGEWVTVKHGSREVKCFITYPEVKDKATAVVVIHEIFGLSDWVRGVTDQLAEAGYIAIAPDLLSGVGPGGGGTEALGGADGARSKIGSLPPDQITADLNAVMAHVAKLPACNGKVAVGGFCWGGKESFRFATNNKNVKSVFSFYGAMPDSETDMARIACPIYGFYGGNDARINASIPKATEMMKKVSKPYDPVIYEGAGHGFMRAGEDPGDTNAANKKARDEAWKRMKELLKKI